MDLPAIPGLLQFGQAAVDSAIRNCAADPVCPALTAVDATCGNGHDSLFLARSLRALCPDRPWTILALDVQQQALDNTRGLLRSHGLDANLRLLLRGHEHLGEILDAEEKSAGRQSALVAVMYNLGYLPGSDKRVITGKNSTLPSLAAAAARLAARGLLAIHAYGGHPGGLEELQAVSDWCANLPPSEWTVARYGIHNRPRKPEALFLIEHSSTM